MCDSSFHQFNDGICFPCHSNHIPDHLVFRQDTICCSAIRLKSDGSIEASTSVYITFENNNTEDQKIKVALNHTYKIF